MRNAGQKNSPFQKSLRHHAYLENLKFVKNKGELFLANGGEMSEKFYFEELMDAWNDHDPEKLLTFYHEDIFYRDPVASKGVQGKEKFEEYLKHFLRDTEKWEWKFTQYYKTKDDRYFVKWKAIVHLQDEVVVEEGVDIIEFYDQRIVLHEMYFDRSKILN